MNLIEVINAGTGPAPDPNDVPGKYVMECLTTDSEGDGMLFAELLKGKLLYAATNTCWYIWRGHAWQRDKTDLVLGLVRYVTDRYGQEILELEEKIEQSKQDNDEEDHKVYAKAWNRKIELLKKKISALRQERGRNACIKFAHTHFGNPFAITGDEFDKNEWLLGVQNGVVNLKTGQLVPGDPAQLISKQCACNFVPLDDINMDGWMQFLADIYDSDQELIEFLQILFGYALTGLTSEHLFPFFLGRGRNGKSLLVNSLLRVLGDYAATVPCELFLKNNQPRSANQTDPGIMKLEGLRLAVSSEVEEGSRFSAQQVKRLTGGDNLEGRNPYDKELREFKPTHLNIMVGNHEPIPPTGDPAFWDRTFLIHHPVRFVKANPNPEKNERLADPDIEKKLEGMDEQILAWMVEGCLKWQKAGQKIIPPASVLKNTEEYQADADWIAQFVDACCVRDPARTTGSSALYNAFVAWYQENINAKKTQTPSQRAFGLKIKASGDFKHTRRGDGVYYKGIALNPVWEHRMMEDAFSTHEPYTGGL